MDKLEHIRSIADLDEQTLSWAAGATREEMGMAISLGTSFMRELDRIASARTHEQAIAMRGIASELPVYKGQAGEEFVQSVLDKRFGGVSNVAKSAMSGDLTLFIQHRKIVVEVKNYKNSVPSTQVEKFQRDLSTTNACGGVFISLRTAVAGVTDSFAIRHERAETKTVPCAYLVSSDESAIVVAVNVISQLISSLEYVNSSLYSRDKVIESVYSIADRLDDVSKVRNDLQTEIGDITGKLMKTSLGLVTAESGIRKSIDQIRSELFHSQAPDVEPAMAELEKNPYFSKHPADVKKCVYGVMTCVHETLHKADVNGSAWKLSAKKCVNTLSGVGFLLGAHGIDVAIPRSKVGTDTIVTALNTFGKRVCVDDANVCVGLDASTYGWLCQVISAR